MFFDNFEFDTKNVITITIVAVGFGAFCFCSFLLCPSYARTNRARAVPFGGGKKDHSNDWVDDDEC